jgi:hypothetical protein
LIFETIASSSAKAAGRVIGGKKPSPYAAEGSRTITIKHNTPSEQVNLFYRNLLLVVCGLRKSGQLVAIFD